MKPLFSGIGPEAAGLFRVVAGEGIPQDLSATKMSPFPTSTAKGERRQPSVLDVIVGQICALPLSGGGAAPGLPIGCRRHPARGSELSFAFAKA